MYPDGTSSASAIDGLNSTIYNADGTPKVDSTIFNQMKTEVYPDGTSSASAIETLSTGYDDPDGGTGTVSLEQAMDTQLTLNGTLKGQYTLKIDNAGHIAGFGLANTSSAAGNATSDFLVQADKFAVLPPSTTHSGSFPTTNLYHGRPVYRSDLDETYYYDANNTQWSTLLTHLPFAVVTTSQTIQGATVPPGVYLDTAFMNKGRVLELIAGSVVADYISATVAMDAPYLFGGTINMGQISKPTSDPRTWTVTSPSVRTSNFSVDALGVMHANSAVMEGVTIKAPDGTVLVDAGGMTGSSGGNLVYNGNFRRGAYTFNSSTSTWTESTTDVDGFASYSGTVLERKDLGYIRCGNNSTGQGYVRSTTQRFPVVPGETLYVYAQTSGTTGAYMGVAFYDHSDGAVTTGYVSQQVVSTSAGTIDSKTITVGGNSRASLIAAITVPTSAQYGEVRFGSNTGDYVYYFNIGVSRTPPEISPQYAATYIRDLSVDTLQIAGNAVTVADSASTFPTNAGAQYVTLEKETSLLPPNSAIIWLINCIVNETSGNPDTYDLVVNIYTRGSNQTSYPTTPTDTKVIWIYSKGIDARMLEFSLPTGSAFNEGGYMKCSVRLQVHQSSPNPNYTSGTLVNGGGIEIVYLGAKK